MEGLEKYKNSSYPEETTNPKVKAEDKYGLQYAKAFYAEWFYGRCSAFNNYRAKIIENEQYIAGDQDTLQYDTYVGDDEDKETSFLNLDRRIANFVSKTFDAALGILMKYDAPIRCDAIDDISVSEKQRALYDKIIKIRHSDVFENIEKTAGMRLGPMPQPNEPQTEEEAEINHALFFKLDMELAMEEALDLVFSVNDWMEISKQLKKDWLKAGIACAENTFLDNGYIAIKNIDPKKLMFSFPEKPDFSDVKTFGYIDNMLLSEIRKLAGDKFTDQQYTEIASESVKNGMNTWPERFKDINDLHGFQIAVMKFEYKTTNRIVKKEKADKAGNPRVYKKDHDWEPEKEDSKKLNYEYETYYSGYWIVGTNYVFGYGPNSNVPREPSNLYKACKTFVVYAPHLSGGKIHSIAERVIPFCNNIQVIRLKMQSIKTSLQQSGIGINWTALMGVMAGQGGEEMEPLELLKMFRQTGVLLYDKHGNNDKAIESIIIDYAPMLAQLSNEIEIEKQNIRDTFGVNKVVDGGLPSPDQPVGTSKMAAQGSINTLFPINDAYRYMKVETAKALAGRVQEVAAQGKGYSAYAKAFGENNMRILTLSNKLSMAQMGIKMEYVPDDEEKMFMEQAIQFALKSGLIRLEDSFMIRRVGNPKMAERYLTIRSEINERKMAQSKMQDIQANAESQMAAAASAVKMELEKERELHLMELEKIDREKGWDFRIEKMKVQNGLDKITVKGQIDENIKDQEHFNAIDQEKAKAEIGQIPAIQ